MEIKNGSMFDNRYIISSRIGHGGMANVYEASDVITKNKVAIKLIKEDVMKNPVNLKRFENEATIAASLRHPNIVKVYSNGVIDGIPYIVTEFVKGQTLKDILDLRSSLPLEESILYMLQLTNALYYAHLHGVIHRDIKPDNVMILADGTAKLTDFGIALAEGVKELTVEAKEIVGSVHYLAPEIAKGKHASIKSDIYSLGVAFFEMITGHVPFDGNSPVNIVVAHVKEKFPSPRKYLPDCPKEVEKLILTATKKDPEERFANAKVFHDELEALLAKPELIKEKKSFLARLFGFK